MVRLTKIKTIYEDGLEIPVIVREDNGRADLNLMAEFRPEGLKIISSDYLPAMKDRISKNDKEQFDLLNSEFSLIKQTINYWKNHNLFWVGLIAGIRTKSPKFSFQGYFFYRQKSKSKTGKWFNCDFISLERKRTEIPIKDALHVKINESNLTPKEIMVAEELFYKKLEVKSLETFFVNQGSTKTKIISFDYINNKRSGITLKLKNNLKVKLERFEIGFLRNNKKYDFYDRDIFVLGKNDIETLEELINIYPSVIKKNI